ncbi:MAG: hypothetical protein JST42_25605 [Bacteroidetes bacterium]|nr:hypothetical protein [Bacteroidota bacterium]
MNVLGQKKYRIIFKSILVLLYVSLLGSQLSHKFYIHANFRARSFAKFRSVPAQPNPVIHGNISLINHEKAAALSIDKRYQLESLFDLATPLFQLSFLPFYPARVDGLYHASLKNLSVAIPSLRGPPLSLHCSLT